MKTLKELKEEWKKDHPIIHYDIEKTITDIPYLHWKWLGWYSDTKKMLEEASMTLQNIYMEVYKGYYGKQTAEYYGDHPEIADMADLVFKTNKERDAFLESEPSVMEQQRVISDLQARVEYMKEVLDSIKFRSNIVRYIIENRKLEAGM